MPSRHLFKMLVGLVGMGIIGIACLLVVSLYEKQGQEDAGSKTTQVQSSSSIPSVIPHTPKGGRDGCPC